MKQEDKKAVAQIYGVKYTYLESWIEHIAFVRNICAHYGRLYNVNLSKTPALYKQYTKQGISSVRVFATLVCLSNILPRDKHWNDFIDLYVFSRNGCWLCVKGLRVLVTVIT